MDLEYREKLKEVNEKFADLIQEAVRQNPYENFIPSVTNYIDQVKGLDEQSSQKSDILEKENISSAAIEVIELDSEPTSDLKTPERKRRASCIKSAEQPAKKKRFQEEKDEKKAEEEAAKKAKEEERLRKKAEKEEEKKRLAEEKQRLAEEKQRLAEEKAEEKRRQAEEKQRALDEKKRLAEEKQRALDEKKRLAEEKQLEKKRAQEEEKKKAEEAKRNAEEAKRKADEEAQRKKKAQQIDKFLIKKVKPERQVISAPSDHWLFSDFEVKDNMTVAPTHRRSPLTMEEKEKLLKTQVDKSDYLEKLPPLTVTAKPNKMKAKLYQFCDSYRPPYYGTWMKKSRVVTGRRPFAKEDIFDYDYDSDEEWEEEEEGDECKSDEEDLEDDENEEEDDGFFVEHGYLSSDEGESDDQRVAGETEEERKRRLKERAQEWENEQMLKERRHHQTKLIPQVYGPTFSAAPPEVNDSIKRNLLAGIILYYIDN